MDAQTATAKHTPGPWKCDSGVVPPDGPETYADIYADGGDLIIARFNNQIPEGRANARLIAAAPDLLVCGLDIISCADANDQDCMLNALVALRAAISKART